MEITQHFLLQIESFLCSDLIHNVLELESYVAKLRNGFYLRDKLPQ